MARLKPKSQARIDGQFRPATLLPRRIPRYGRPRTAGVLTHAPAGMHTTAACVAQPDGTLAMLPRACADSMEKVVIRPPQERLQPGPAGVAAPDLRGSDQVAGTKDDFLVLDYQLIVEE